MHKVKVYKKMLTENNRLPEILDFFLDESLKYFD